MAAPDRSCPGGERPGMAVPDRQERGPGDGGLRQVRPDGGWRPQTAGCSGVNAESGEIKGQNPALPSERLLGRLWRRWWLGVLRRASNEGDSSQSGNISSFDLGTQKLDPM